MRVALSPIKCRWDESSQGVSGDERFALFVFVMVDTFQSETQRQEQIVAHLGHPGITGPVLFTLVPSGSV
jgi:hypothetical protein